MVPKFQPGEEVDQQYGNKHNARLLYTCNIEQDRSDEQREGGELNLDHRNKGVDQHIDMGDARGGIERSKTGTPWSATRNSMREARRPLT